MRSKLRKLAFITALAVSATGINLVPAMASSQDQDRHGDRDNQNAQSRDYSNNRYYRVGSREGQQDRERNRQRKNHNHHFRNDEDRQAHDAGYQRAWSGDQPQHHDDHQDPH